MTRLKQNVFLSVSLKFKVILFNPLNDKLNPICHLLSLLGAHHILHISRVSVNSKNKSENDVSRRAELENGPRPFLVYSDT